MLWSWTLSVLLAAAGAAATAPQAVSFPTSDGGRVHADLYGAGDHGVVLAHGGRFNKESWKEQAVVLAGAGYRVLAIDFRGYGESRGGGDTDDPYAGIYLDVLAAVRWLRDAGARTVSVVGGSMGAGAAAEAMVVAEPGEIDRAVLLAPYSIDRPEAIKGSKLFIVTRDDPNARGEPRLVKIREQFERAPEPKELLVLEGSAHAQYIFDTDQAGPLMDAILRFLNGEGSASSSPASGPGGATVATMAHLTVSWEFDTGG